MDVYRLILERGTLGALAYANHIEKDNIRLASEIDKAVNELVIAQHNTSKRYAQYAQSPDFGPLRYDTAPSDFQQYQPTKPTQTEQEREIIENAKKVLHDYNNLPPDKRAEMPRLWADKPMPGVGFSFNQVVFAKNIVLYPFLAKTYIGKKVLEKGVDWYNKKRGIPSPADAGEAEGVKASMGLLDKAIKWAEEESPVLANGFKATKWLLEKLPWIATILDFGKFISEWQEGGFDWRTACFLANAIVSAIGIYPAARIATIPLNIALSLGCESFHHEKAKPSDVEMSDKQLEANKDITFDKLSDKDKQTLQTIITNSVIARQEPMSQLRQDARSGAFESPGDVLSLFYKFNNTADNPNAIIPGVSPLGSDKYQASHQDEVAKFLKSSYTFNQKKFAMALR